MKAAFTRLKLITIFCCAFAALAVMGQTTYTWVGLLGTNGTPDGTNIASAANWSPSGGPPSGSTGDTGQWNGTVPGNLIITYASGLPGTGYGTLGINLNLTAAQVGNVSIVPVDGGTANAGVHNINVASGAGAFALGDANDSENILNIVSRPAGATLDWINDSTNAAVIYPNVRWQAGGGEVYELRFDGSGNWCVTNSLATAGGPGTLVSKYGSGTVYWNGPSVNNAAPNAGINSPFNIAAGTVVLEWNNYEINNVNIQNSGTLLEYNAPSQSQTLNGVISGSAPLQVNAGTLTLSGANTYTNTTILSGGELILDAAENAGTDGPLGVGGTISFQGGTLGFSTNNTFDYSSRFSTAPGQAYSFDTGGQSVTLATGLASYNGTLNKAGMGTLTLGGPSIFRGPATVNAGKLVFQGYKTGFGNITVADNAALGVYATGTQIMPTTLTLGTSAGATLEFNNVNSTTTAPIAAGTLSAAGTLTVNVNSGTFTAGLSYPLLTWTNGSSPTVALGTLNGADGNLSISGSTLYLNVAPMLNFTPGGNNSLEFSWTGSDILQAQTNGLNGSWFDYPGGGASPVAIPINLTNSVFFRLAPAP